MTCGVVSENILLSTTFNVTAFHCIEGKIFCTRCLLRNTGGGFQQDGQEWGVMALYGLQV